MTILKPGQIWTLYGLQPCLLLQEDDWSGDPMTWEVLVLESGVVDIARGVGEDVDNELVSVAEEWK